MVMVKAHVIPEYVMVPLFDIIWILYIISHVFVKNKTNASILSSMIILLPLSPKDDHVTRSLIRVLL